jgi:copper chaperone NosL
MAISERRFAGELVSPKGRVLTFDSLECLANHGRPPGAKAWVYDYESEKLVAEEAAWVVRHESIRSPMGGALAAFEGRERADGFAKTRPGALVRPFSEIRSNSSTLPSLGGFDRESEAQ